MNARIVTYGSREALMRKLADRLADRLGRLVAENGRASIAVPGGTTPAPMLERLGRADLPWEKVGVTLTDERWVPVSSPRSNQRLLGETLFTGAAAAAEFAPLYGGTPEPAQSLNAVTTAIRQIILPLDVAVLGMGTDMHTASLFPGAVGLAKALSADAPPVVAIRAPGAEEPRITLSAPALAAAETHLLITGAEKRAALEKALSLKDPKKAPVCAVLDGATVHYAE